MNQSTDIRWELTAEPRARTDNAPRNEAPRDDTPVQLKALALWLKYHAAPRVRPVAAERRAGPLSNSPVAAPLLLVAGFLVGWAGRGDPPAARPLYVWNEPGPEVRPAADR